MCVRTARRSPVRAKRCRPAPPEHNKLHGSIAVDLTPIVPAGRQVIERYGASGFRVSGVIYPGPVLVFPDRTLPWGVSCAADVAFESLAPVIEHRGVRILLLGLGRLMS